MKTNKSTEKPIDILEEKKQMLAHLDREHNLMIILTNYLYVISSEIKRLRKRIDNLQRTMPLFDTKLLDQVADINAELIQLNWNMDGSVNFAERARDMLETAKNSIDMTNSGGIIET